MSKPNEIQQLESYVGPEKLCVADYSQAQYVFSLGAIREINKAFERLLENRRPSTARDLSLEELENKKQELEGKIAAYDHYIRRQGNLPDCNTCGIKKECEYAPGWGEYVRVNCPLWKAKES